MRAAISSAPAGAVCTDRWSVVSWIGIIETPSSAVKTPKINTRRLQGACRVIGFGQ
jgi:hypothetical protein